MCGILGYLDKRGDDSAPVGRILLRMLLAVGCRGPDSSGVALYGPERGESVLRVKIGDDVRADERTTALIALAERKAVVRAVDLQGATLRLAVEDDEEDDLLALVGEIERLDADVEVVSLGRRLEIVKEVGTPETLEAVYGVSRLTGTHGIGHTRLATESRIDLSHSQPFWAHGLPDVATVHNGHITNYHKLRRIYEQRGVRFYTDNDSEIIGIYLRDRMGRGDSFAEALRASLRDFDGSFSYLAATADTLAYVKDPFGLKPLVVAETEQWVAIATEEIALRQALPGDYRAREAVTRDMHLWHVPQRATLIGA
jgi:methylamine---glutamate N-methyltransferase subunit A